jgi:3'-phosphoadenosine 5'-phosphosulfate sulfotransferase (PAPS reductase)/FAD synthetase
MRIISLGWGVQSFGLAAMVAKGVLPPVDAAVHSDTTHERRETYEFRQRWTPWLEERGVRVVTAQAERTRPDEHWGNTPGIRIAAYTTWPDGTPSGMMGRQCTRDWKISPIRRWLQANRGGEPVEMWLGITLDEVTRMKPSDV